MWLLSLHLQIKILQSYQLSGMKTMFEVAGPINMKLILSTNRASVNVSPQLYF